MKSATLLASLGAIVLCTGVAAFAPVSGGTFQIIKYTMDGGGGTSSSGALAVTGTIGQPDVLPGSTGMSGGDFVLIGGFHCTVGDVVSSCPADLNDDGEVGFSDLVDVLAAWGACVGCPADIDGDGFVAFSDLLAILAAWGPCE